MSDQKHVRLELTEEQKAKSRPPRVRMPARSS